MRTLVFLIVSLLFCCGCQSVAKASDSKTTLILVRHAEKEKGPNPDLTEAGQRRAEALKDLAEFHKITGLITSGAKRTIQTATPLSQLLNLEIKSDVSPLDYQQLQSYILDNYEGKTVFLVGHSNTVPHLINYLIGQDILKDIPETDFTKLFVVDLESKQVSEFKQEVADDGSLLLTKIK